MRTFAFFAGIVVIMRGRVMQTAAGESILRARALAVLGGLVLLLTGADSGRAADYYFDVNGTNAWGDGAGGLRNTGAAWSFSSLGTGTTFSLNTINTVAGTSGTNSFQFGFGTQASGNTTNSGTVGIGSASGGSLPTVGALIFNASGTSGSGYTFLSGSSSPTFVTNVTITGSATNGVSLGTGILVNSDVTGATTFTAPAGIALASNQAWTNNSGTAALIVNGPVSGAFSLTTNGPGTIVLGAANTFSSLTVGAGTTRITNASATGSGSLTVNSGGNLNLLASISKSIANSGTITIGAGGGLTAASIGTGALSLAGASGTGASFTSTAASTLAPAAVTMAGNSTITLGSATTGILSSGAATISGASNILSVGGITSAGNTYTLLSGASLTNTGSITLTGAAVGNQSLTLGGSGTIGRTTYTFGSTATALQLAVTGTVYDLSWNGGASGAWDYTTANWQKDGTGANIVFVAGDLATIGSASTITVDSGTFGSSVQAASLTVNNAAGTVALSGSAISTTGTFGKSGAGDLTIANAATYGAGAWVSGGSMTANGPITLTASGLNVSGGVATLTNASTITGGITVTGGTAALNAANTVSGAVSASGGGVISLGNTGGVGSGSISLDNGGLTSSLSSPTITNAIALGSGGGTVAGTNPLTLSGAITGPGTLAKTGAGELTVSGSLGTSTTGVAVSVAAGAATRLTGAAAKWLSTTATGTVDGTLTLDNASVVLKSGTVLTGTGSIVLVGASTITGTTTSFSTIATPITGAGSLSFGASPLGNSAASTYVTLSGSNSYSGGTTLNQNVGMGSSSAFGTGLITATRADNHSRINNVSGGPLTLANNVTVGAGNIFSISGANPIRLTGTITGGGNIKAFTGGVIDLTQQTAATMLSTGTIDIGASGVLQISDAGNLGSLTAILASNTNSKLQAFGNTGTISQPVTIGSTGTSFMVFTVDTNGYDATLAGVIQNLNGTNIGGITKAGSGVLTVTNASTYTGPTTVSAGTLLVNGSLYAGGASGATTTVASAAVLGGSGTIGGSVIFSAGANFRFDAASILAVNSGTVSFGGFAISNVLGLDASTPEGIYTLLGGGATFDLANVSNVGASNAASLGSGKTAYFQQGSLQVVVVPEPATVALAVTGVACMAAFAARRKRLP